MYIIIINYVKPMEQVDSLLCAHREFLQLGFDAGVFLLSGPRCPRYGGVILAQASSREVVMSILHQDPFYVYGIADYQVMEFKPNRWCEQFSAFFK